MIEKIILNGVTYAEVIRSGVRVNHTHFFSQPESSFQFGLLAHEAGFEEPAHYHQPFERKIKDLLQMFVMQRGRVVIDLYDDRGIRFQEIVLGPGDAIVLANGVHGLRVIEDFQAISVKQGPFLGSEKDKIFVEVEKL